MRWHVRVTPVPNEAELVTHRQVMAAKVWNKRRLAEGVFSRCQAWAITGGYWELEASSVEEIMNILAPYPLMDTIELEFIELAGEDDESSLDDGFAVLDADIDAVAQAARGE